MLIRLLNSKKFLASLRIGGRRAVGLIFLLAIVFSSLSFAQPAQPPQSSSQRALPISESSAASSARYNPLEHSQRFDPNSLERSQRFGVQQVGEASPEATRPLAARPAASGPEVIVEKADLLVKQGQITRAVELYHKALGAQPELLGARIGLGYAFFQQGDFEAAANEFRQVIAIAPNNAEAKLNLGAALYRGGNISQAIEQYQRALTDRKEQFPAAHFNLAMAYAHEGDLNQAVAHYRSAIEQRGNYPEACNNLGLVYEAMADTNDAAAQYRLAIQQQRGNYPLAHYNLARFYSNETKFDDAIVELRLAVKQQENFPEAYLDLGNLYILRSSLNGSNELDLAIGAFKKAIELRNNIYPLAHENLAIALAKKTQRAEALKEYRIAFEQYSGQCPETLNNLVVLLENKTIFLIGNELSRLDNPGNLKYRKSERGGDNQNDIDKYQGQLAQHLREALDKYQELDDELKDADDARYCAGLAFAAVSDWKNAIDELARAVEISNKQDAEAARAIAAIIESVRYY
jgi:tetratricopeptide (TPR) repeat protein